MKTQKSKQGITLGAEIMMVLIIGILIMVIGSLL